MKIFLILYTLIKLSFQENTPIKFYNITTGITGEIGTLQNDDEFIMKPPFYVVPIQPDDIDSFNKLIRVDLDTGGIYLLKSDLTDQIKFSALSINQGSAMTVILNPLILPKITHCFNLYNNLKSDRTVSDVDKCVEIDSKIFQNSTCESKQEIELGIKCLNEPQLVPNEKNYKVSEVSLRKNLNGLYFLNFKCEIHHDWLISLNILDERINLEIYNENLLALFNLDCNLTQVTASTTTMLNSVIQINKFSFNLKLYTIVLISLVSSLIGFLLVLGNLLVRKINLKREGEEDVKNYPFKSSILSVNTIDTRTSVLIDYFDQSNTAIMDTNKLILDEKNLNSKLQYSTGYLSQMGINVTEDLKDLKDLDEKCVNLGRVSQDEVCDLTVKKWCNLLDWKVDYASYSNVFDDLAKFNK
ncbi:unnamed protein product [Brachionus calyciflorus]|uniref:Uncharacterized protein n=1 Tax=Brachionus calyciflorus TaxID=104777 RepID=A0A813M3D8_9BILA|nr:unnamed protein product [Brachionus calyciflorus]